MSYVVRIAISSNGLHAPKRDNLYLIVPEEDTTLETFGDTKVYRYLTPAAGDTVRSKVPAGWSWDHITVLSAENDVHDEAALLVKALAPAL